MPPAAAAAAAATPTLLVGADVGAAVSALALRLGDGAVQQAYISLYLPISPYISLHLRSAWCASAARAYWPSCWWQQPR